MINFFASIEWSFLSSLLPIADPSVRLLVSVLPGAGFGVARPVFERLRIASVTASFS